MIFRAITTLFLLCRLINWIDCAAVQRPILISGSLQCNGKPHSGALVLLQDKTGIKVPQNYRIMIKDGKLRKYNKGKISGSKWPEVYCTLQQDSTFSFYDKRGDRSAKGSLKLAELAPYIAVGQFTKVVPDRPPLPSGATEYHLLAVGTGPNGFIHWFMFLNDDDLNDWMTKIASTLPKAPPPQQPPQQPSAGSQPPPPAYPSAPQQPSSGAYYPPAPPQQNYGSNSGGPMGQPVAGAMYPSLQPAQPALYYSGGYPQPGRPSGYAPQPAAYPAQPAAPSTTVIVQDRGGGGGGGGGYDAGSRSGGGGLGTAGGLASGMLMGGVLGYGLSSLMRPSWGGWGCGSGWGGSMGGGPSWGGRHGMGGGYIQNNDTTIINNYNFNDDSRTTNTNSEYNMYDNNNTDDYGSGNLVNDQRADDYGGGGAFDDAGYGDSGGYGDDYGGGDSYAGGGDVETGDLGFDDFGGGGDDFGGGGFGGDDW